MPKEKFYEVVKRLGVKTPEAKQILAELGFEVKSNFTQMSDEMINALMVALDARAEVKDAPEPKPERAIGVKKDTVDRKMQGMQLGDKPEEVIFFSPSRCHDIAYKKEVYFPGTPKIRDAAQSIRFDDYEYRTSDPEKIEFIKSTRSFKVRSTSYPDGKIRIVTEEKLARLKIARQPKVTEIKSTGDRLPGDVDMSPLPV